MNPPRWWTALVDPVPAEKRARLAALWAELDPRWREPLQGLGRQTTGCGATIGIQPRCDFDCRGCYLGAGANAAPRASGREAAVQLAALRRHLGPKANLQLTDGEVTLLPERELLNLVRRARRLGAIPMLMTHGETLRRRPRLLDRLVEAGLTEVSFHVDSLQAGRRRPWSGARSERELDGLRAELAALVRSVRRRTGVRLRAATTLTVSRDNLAEIGAVVAWAFAHRDVFGLVSMQPLARVGRTRAELRGVGVDELWREIARGLEPWAGDLSVRGPLRLGHPDCTRVEPMVVIEHEGEAPRALRLVRPDAADDRELVARFLERGLGGLNFRDDSPSVRLLRGLGVLARAPGLLLGEVGPWLGRRLAEAGTSPARLVLDRLRGRVRVDSFQVVSHHFMDAAEIATARGRERLDACVFRVPVEGSMVPMCAVNAEGIRDRLYGSPGLPAPSGSAARPARVRIRRRGRKAGTASR